MSNFFRPIVSDLIYSNNVSICKIVISNELQENTNGNIARLLFAYKDLCKSWAELMKNINSM